MTLEELYLHGGTNNVFDYNNESVLEKRVGPWLRESDLEMLSGEQAEMLVSMLSELSTLNVSKPLSR